MSLSNDFTLSTPSELHDIVVIGGGPAGSAAAIYAARADLETMVLDKGVMTGALGMTSKIVNYPGVTDAPAGAELLERIRDQAQDFGALFKQDKVLTTELEGEIKTVHGSKKTYQARVVIIASGSMGRSRSVEGENRLLGRGVSYCATCDGAFFRDEDVAVAGNNEEALEEALFLTRFASKVHLLVHTRAFQAETELVTEAEAHPEIEIYPQTRLVEVLGEHQVEAVRIDPREGDEKEIPVAGLFIYLQGMEPITDFVGDQLPTDEGGCLIVDRTMQTAIPGVFAVGDVLCNHLKQAVISAAEGVTAAMAAQRYLSGRKKLRPDWS